MSKAFQKATKKKAKLRAAIYGPSGAGKTYTALRLARGFNMVPALIDTEDPLNGGSASKYADRFDFDCMTLPNPNIVNMTDAINTAAREGYTFLIIDSLTHVWQELLGEVDKIAQSKYKGNTFSAWSEGTPKQREFVKAIISFPGHVVATMRSKTEWVTEKDEKSGRTRPVRIGLAPDQGKSIEYEFDILINLNVDNYATIEKDRTGKFQNEIIHKPDEAFAQKLLDWLSEGVDELAGDDQIDNIMTYMHLLPTDRQEYVNVLLQRGISPAIAAEILQEIKLANRERKRNGGSASSPAKNGASKPAPQATTQAPAAAPAASPAAPAPAQPVSNGANGHSNGSVRPTDPANVDALYGQPAIPGKPKADPMQEAANLMNDPEVQSMQREMDQAQNQMAGSLFDADGNLNNTDDDLPF